RDFHVTGVQTCALPIFPHLMLRYRAAERKAGHKDAIGDQLSQTDRNGKLAGVVAGLANWASDRGNQFTRGLMEKTADIHRDAERSEERSVGAGGRARGA